MLLFPFSLFWITFWKLNRFLPLRFPIALSPLLNLTLIPFFIQLHCIALFTKFLNIWFKLDSIDGWNPTLSYPQTCLHLGKAWVPWNTSLLLSGIFNAHSTIRNFLLPLSLMFVVLKILSIFWSSSIISFHWKFPLHLYLQTFFSPPPSENWTFIPLLLVLLRAAISAQYYSMYTSRKLLKMISLCSSQMFYLCL